MLEMKKNKCIRGHQLTDETRLRRFIDGKWKLYGCRVCALDRSRRWHQDNKEDELLNSKKRYLLNRTDIIERTKARQCFVKHGITLQQREEILKQQNGCCANIGCRREIPKGGHLDHNHVTGKIRGILCSQCNMVLGLVNDSCERLRGLEKYLENV
jgi:hypothetical protein